MNAKKGRMSKGFRLFSIAVALSMLCALFLLAGAAAADEGAPAAGPEGVNCNPVGGKFHDLDWDAQNWESGEPGLSGWTIKFKMEASPYSEYWATTLTSAPYGSAYLGKFEFPSMPGSTYSPKIYIVSEVLQTGWMQTYPNTNGGKYRIKYFGGTSYSLLSAPPSGYANTLNFGNAKLGTIGSIGDCVWHDADRDGNGPVGCTKGPVWDNESVIPNVGVQLLIKTGPNTIATVVAQQTTGADGKYLFPDLNAGDYIVDVLEGSVLNYFGGPFVKTTTEPYPYTLAQGENHRHADFGFDNNPGPVYVGDWVWYDIDKDGKQNDGKLLYTSPNGDMYDTGIACVEVRLYVGSTGATDVSQLTQIGVTNTDGWGNYAFPLMKPNTSGQSYFTGVGTGSAEDPDVASFIVYYNGGSSDHTCGLAPESVDPAYLYLSGAASALMSPRMGPDGGTTPPLLSTSLPTAGGFDLGLDFGFSATPTAVSIQVFGAAPVPLASVEVALAAAGALVAGALALKRRR